ncbi:uncharacterized protein LOC131227484 [Magnolia sinica]|uniref:uncharacterized protein LOC131227484 n=1 Tax=Magnolia sinica TaxID=86752 RepID=UPI00265AE453|nr:uncharacterized protein LOC131227484 [Magnolia sinica]
MDFHMEGDIPTPYVSAPSSPCRRSSFNGPPYFYSVPGSPTSPIVALKWESKLGVAKSAKDDDNFEFGTSQRFESLMCPHNRHTETSMQQQQQQQQQQKMGELPITSFADELFCNGQLRPLKLPPRLQFESSPSFCVSSRRSPGSASCGPIYRRSFKNKNIDPFAAALDEIRKEDVGIDQGTACRRTRSFSSFRTFRWGRNRASGPQHHDNKIGPLEPTWQFTFAPKEPIGPKKSSYVRPTDDTWQLTLFPTGPTKPIKSTSTGPTRKSIFPGPRVNKCEPSKKISRWVSFVNWSKRKMNKDRPKLDLRNQAAVMRKREDIRSLSFRSVHEAHYNGKKGVYEDMRKKTIIPYKPSGLFVCFGFGSKDMKYRK